MKHFLAIVFILSLCTNKIAAQQNWAAIPCFELKYGDAISKIVRNEAQDELILGSSYSYKICGKTYKSFFAFNGTTFHDMNYGIQAQTPNLWLAAPALGNCVEWNGKAIITGNFSTVGSDTLPAKYIATWNGSVWDTFPHPFWSNRAIQSPNTSFGMAKMLKDNTKIWMFPGYDTAQNLTFKPVLYDGTNFAPIPDIPVNVKSAVVQAVKYHNKLIVMGNFFEMPSQTYARLAQFDGTSWSPVSTGVRGNLTGVWDLAVYNDTLYIAGNFNKADGNAGNYIMKWDGSQLTDAGWGGWCGYGPIYRLLTFKNRLYALGGFNCALNQKAFGVAYYENGAWTVPQDSIPNGVTDAVVYKDAIYIGGYFESINGDSTIRKFAKLICPDFDAASGCASSLKETSNEIDGRVFPNPTNDKLYLEFKQNIDKIHILNTLGQEVYHLKTQGFNKEIDVSHLPTGIYFLKAENRQGQSAFKFIKE